jgi:hypothetical protein
MKVRYKLHWSSGCSPSPELKWQIWDWKIKHPIIYLENRAIGRQICALLNTSIISHCINCHALFGSTCYCFGPSTPPGAVQKEVGPFCEACYNLIYVHIGVKRHEA